MKVPICLIALITTTLCLSQELSLSKGKFYKGDVRIDARQFVKQMESNREAFAIATKAKSNYDVSNVLGFIGGFMIGWPLGTAIGGGEPEWGLAIGGAAIVGIAIPIQSSASKKFRSAAGIYNQAAGLDASASLFKVNLSPGGVGVSYNF